MEKTAQRVEYPARSTCEFYRDTTDYIIAQNHEGVQILELRGDLPDEDPDGRGPELLDIRSPRARASARSPTTTTAWCSRATRPGCSTRRATTPSSSAASASSPGTSLVSHPTVRALVLASNLDGRPDCVNCAYNPTAAPARCTPQDPGLARRAHAREHHLHGAQGHPGLPFTKIRQNDPDTMEVFRRWWTNRAREHFLHTPE